MIPRRLDWQDMPVDKVIPYENNPKIHTPEEVDFLASLLVKYGWTQAIIIDKDNVIIAGHKRRLAAIQLGEKTVPVEYRDDLTEAEVNALRIADNKSNESKWHFERLDTELVKLQAFDVDIKEAGFDNLPDRWNVDETGYPALPSGDRAPFQQMTFTLSDDQAEEVKRALEKAKDMGHFIDTGNENSNGNALARIAETFNGIS